MALAKRPRRRTPPVATPTAPETPPGQPAAAPAERSFLELSLEEASALAESQGRPWRVGRVDGERFSVTQDFVVGRVTFELDDGVVTEALIEGAEEQPVDRAGLLGGAIERLVKVDNSFGGGTPFERIEVENRVGGAAASVFESAERDLIAGAINDVAEVVFIDDSRLAIEGYFEQAEPVAVVSVSALRVEGERAEVDLQLWCGSTCGVFLTYEAVREAGSWRILGATGPIAVS